MTLVPAAIMLSNKDTVKLKFNWGESVSDILNVAVTVQCLLDEYFHDWLYN